LATFDRARRISDAQFGAGHAHAGTAAVNSALSHLELGQIELAVQQAQQGFEIYKHAYREVDDPRNLQNEATVWGLFVRAEALAAKGDLDSAIEDHEFVRTWRSARLPAGHAHQASSLFALAEATWKRDGDTCKPEVVDFHRAALLIREKVFGVAPNFWLAQSQARLGLLTGNSDMLSEAHAFYSAQLKPGHWRTAAVAEALDGMLQALTPAAQRGEA
jgi:tetratricopeptide (TPR) repeat protein